MTPEHHGYLDILERRAWFLERRIAASGLDLTHDKAEVKALVWACTTLRSMSATGAARVGGPQALEGQGSDSGS